MEKIIQKSLDTVYKDYLFLGTPRTDEEILDVGISSDESAALALIERLQVADKEMKWQLLDAALRAFTLCSEEEYAVFLQHIRLTKRGRYMNERAGLIPGINRTGKKKQRTADEERHHRH